MVEDLKFEPFQFGSVYLRLLPLEDFKVFGIDLLSTKFAVTFLFGWNLLKGSALTGDI